jgi:hypothetical protein
MARPFSNSSSANKAFGVFSGSQDAGIYLYNKKAKTTYCNANICTPTLTVGSESNYLLFKRANKLRVYPCLNSINKANLNINLITKLDLTNVHVIQDFSGNTWPSSINTMNTVPDPYLRYNIDPSGNLFGNTICGINNWEKYMVYGVDKISISNTGALSYNTNPYTGANNGYTYLKFTNSGTITLNSNSGKIYYVIVGGGGNGYTRNSNTGGGGGGGGQVLSGFVNLTKGVYNITVGSSGQPSSFYTLTAATGLSAAGTDATGSVGGNGGNSGSGGLGGFAVSSVSTLTTGNPGVNGGGGGGGYNVYPAGTGGAGPLINFADGSYGTYFGGGGGGGVSGPPYMPPYYTPASGGSGGGGNGGGDVIATGGSPNTGGGGGGGAWDNNGIVSPAGGAGASGVVLIYYI